MTTRTRTRPLLSDVVQAELRRRIVDGEYPLGSKLPNEDQLCEIFAVSRVTLREAVRALVEEGTVARRHGSGTYVTRRPVLANSLETNFSYSEYLERSGIRASKRVLSSRDVQADEEAAELLGLDVGTPIVEIRRVRLADGRPAIYSLDLLPADIIDRKQDQKSFTGSLYRLLASKGHIVDHAEALLAPAIADKDLAKLLAVKIGTPVQYLRQIDVDVNDRPVMLSHEWHAPSVLELRVYRKGPGSLVNGPR